MAKSEPRSHNILITGATDGIGLLLAQSYAAQGHRILATGRRVIVDDASYFGSQNITYIIADQLDPKHAAHTVAGAMRDLGWTQLDLAILNGAIGWTGDPTAETGPDIQQQVEVNLTSPVLMAKALGPWLFIANGKLVLIGSTIVKKGSGKFATYAATKAGLAGFARSLESEWEGRAQVQMIHPGPTRTSMHKKAGLKVGLAKVFFMSPKRAAKAIQRAIRKGDRQRFITRIFGWGSMFSSGKQGQL